MSRGEKWQGWSDAVVRAALGITADPDETPPAFSEVSTDTRSLKSDALFVALKGERFDGHEFLEAARAAGAGAAIVREGTERVPGLPCTAVADTLTRLRRPRPRARRLALTGPVVAITGTNGKTSTKEMCAAVLRTRFRVHATPANLNNLVGVPSTILVGAR